MSVVTIPGGGGGSGVSVPAPAVVADVNLAEVAGTATVTAGLAGLLAVGGSAADGVAPTGNPILCAGIGEDGNTYTILVDQNGNTQVVGTVADDAAQDSTAPVKGGAVADQVPTSVANDDMVHLITDLERYLRIVSRAYDSLTDSDKVVVQNTIASDRDESAQSIADVVNQAAGTTNYPSDDGVEIGNRDFLSMIYSLNDVTSVAIEGSNDRATWVPITGGATRVADGVSASGTTAATYTSGAGVDTDFALYWEKFGWRYIRWSVAVPNNTNTIEITLFQRAI